MESERIATKIATILAPVRSDSEVLATVRIERSLSVIPLRGGLHMKTILSR